LTLLPDPSTRRAIDQATANLLRDAGAVSPPVKVEQLLATLAVHRDFYDLESPGLIDRAVHRIRVGGDQLRRILREKIKLAALWLPDDRRILIDRGLPVPKQDWAAFHETTHSLLPWHREYFLGDTAQTLDPAFHERLEAEANYGASALRFMGAAFTSDARDSLPVWDRVRALQRRYGTSLQSTARRFVEFGPDLPMLFVVSTPWWRDVPADQPHRCRHVLASPRFGRFFAAPEPDDLLTTITGSSRLVRGGPAGDSETCFPDANGDMHLFDVRHFFNQHDLFTLLVHRCRVTAAAVAVPS
jgi:hypothetical protein